MSDQHTPSTFRQTPLYATHLAAGARMVEFGGWLMPVHYTSIIDEHRAVRTAAGLFDVSHMGEFIVSGTGALAFLEKMVPNSVGRLTQGQALYSQICNEAGGTIDDLLIYFLAPERYMVVVNASTRLRDWLWFAEHAQNVQDVALEDVSDQTALIAIQGPKAATILAEVTHASLADLAYYHATEGTVGDIPCIISRTGYTGEDGFELYHSASQADNLWHRLLDAGSATGLQPAGLGARDTLRLEAGFCLYGHELNEDITPLEADLGWSVKLKKTVPFIGREALQQQKTEGVKRTRIGLRLLERGIARADAPIYDGETQVGILTSGSQSITLGYAIGMGYVDPLHAPVGTRLTVDVRGKRLAAEVVPLPFYKRP